MSAAHRPEAKLLALMREASRRHDIFQVFRDFCAMAAISISNACDRAQAEAREVEYLEIVKRYAPDEVALFPQMLAALTDALEADMSDALGRVFGTLGLGNKWAGQYFTPDHVARMMAAISLGAHPKELIVRRGFIRACEPAVGGGAMVIALCRELREQGINYQQHLHVTATDIDIRAVHMAYLQLSLLHVPAVIVQGNSITLEEWSHWHTPAHILGGWRYKLLRSDETGAHEVISAPPHVPSPPLAPQEEDRAPRQLSLF
jgi:hypothetical protein